MTYSPPKHPGNPQAQRDLAQQYLRQQIEQAGPVEQVLMLYDGAIRFVLQAKSAIENGDIQARCSANRRAMEILAYLVDMVNPEQGGDIGKRLFGIYTGLLRRMLQIDFENSTTVCDELVENIRALRVATAQTLAEMKGAKAAAVSGAAGGTVVASPTGEPAVHVRRNAVA